MANVEITNSKTKGIVVLDPVYDDDIFYNRIGDIIGLPVTYLAGTMLARITETGLLTVYKDTTDDDGTNIPLALLQEDLTFTEANVEIPFRPIVAGRVRREDVVSHFGIVDITNVESDALRDYGIIPLTTVQFAELGDINNG